jgi:hypothetical protein
LAAAAVQGGDHQFSVFRCSDQPLLEAFLAIRENAAKVLASFKLDESAIEAEALRTSAGNLEQLDRWLASLESRRNKLLRNIAEYRGGLARQLKENSDRIIDGKIVTLEITRPVSHRPRPDHDE